MMLKIILDKKVLTKFSASFFDLNSSVPKIYFIFSIRYEIFNPLITIRWSQ